jgi:hypothetical protein
MVENFKDLELTRIVLDNRHNIIHVTISNIKTGTPYWMPMDGELDGTFFVVPYYWDHPHEKN